VTAALEAYRFDEVANRLYQFIWGTYCDWYLEFTKPILQGGKEEDQRETRATTAWILQQIVHLLHPIMPFITEEVWRHLPHEEAGTLMTSDWPRLAFYDEAALADMEWVVEAISAIRAVRSEMNVPPGAYVPYIVQDADTIAEDRLHRLGGHLVVLARVAGGEPADRIMSSGIQVVVAGATFILGLGDIVDLAREKARLAKDIGRLDADLEKIATKLANPGFLAKAKAEVIEEQREREADARRDRDRLKAAYQRLEAV
jgi:valyl-tRNA synthetase